MTIKNPKDATPSELRAHAARLPGKSLFRLALLVIAAEKEAAEKPAGAVLSGHKPVGRKSGGVDDRVHVNVDPERGERTRGG